MKPKPSVNIKAVVSAIIGLLVVIAFIACISIAFGGKNPYLTPSESTPAPTVSEAPPEKTSPPFFSDPETSDPVAAPAEKEPDTEKPNPAPAATPEPAPTVIPEPTPAVTPEPTPEAAPETTPEPVPSVDPRPELSTLTIWNGMMESMGDVMSANMTLSPENLSELYGINASLCENFVLKKSGTVMTPEEYLIVKAPVEQLAVIEQACQQRQMALAEQWQNSEYAMGIINSYQISTIGNYLFFGISPYINQLVGIFQGVMIVP